jgi:hypothetical protein
MTIPCIIIKDIGLPIEIHGGHHIRFLAAPKTQKLVECRSLRMNHGQWPALSMIVWIIFTRTGRCLLRLELCFPNQSDASFKTLATNAKTPMFIYIIGLFTGYSPRAFEKRWILRIATASSSKLHYMVCATGRRWITAILLQQFDPSYWKSPSSYLQRSSVVQECST